MKTQRIWFLTSFIFALLTLACNQSNQTNEISAPKSGEITISAAASLQNAFRQIANAYEQQMNVKVNFNFAASGVLQKQIEQGAPADVFASAGQEQMNQIADKDLIITESRRDFVRNELVLVSSSKSKFANRPFSEYFQAANEKIAIGNPKTVPAGQYAVQMFENLDLLEKIQARFVFGEDVRQVLDYVERNETEYGVVYVSDAQAASEKFHVLARAPEDTHSPIFYPIAVIKTSRNKVAAHKFIDFVMSEVGQKILQENGFQPLK